MTITINREQAIEALKQAVDERGRDFIYGKHYADLGTSCQYTVNGEAACLVGLGLAKLGVPIALLAAIDHGDSDGWIFDDYSIGGSDVTDYLKKKGVILTEEAIEIFTVGQINQDRGNAWGFALDRAIEVAA